MRTLVFVLLLLTASCSLNDYWAREVGQEAQEEGGRFGSFINESHGVVKNYYTMWNGQFLVEIIEEDGQARRRMKMVVTALEDLGRDRRAARSAIIYCEYSEHYQDSFVQKTAKEYLVGSLAFLPHDKMILTSKGVTYNIIFSKANKYLHGLYVILVGAIFIMFSILHWHMKMEYQYNGFQLLNLMLRWYAKILLFGDYNGWNYYFPDNFKELYLVVTVLWVLVEIGSFVYVVGRSNNKCDRIFSLIFCLMLLMPDVFYYFCAFVVLFYEFAWVRSQKLLSYDQLTTFSLFCFCIHIFVVIVLFTPFNMFKTIDPPNSSATTMFFFAMVWAMFLVHFKLPPHLFVVSLALSLVPCCFGNKCAVCNEKHKYSFVEQFLFKKGCRILFEQLVITPCGHAIYKYCLKKHVQGDRTCPIDGQTLSDDWIQENFGKLEGVAPGTVVPNKIAAGEVDFAKAAEAAENIGHVQVDTEGAGAKSVELELELQEEMGSENIAQLGK